MTQISASKHLPVRSYERVKKSSSFNRVIITLSLLLCNVLLLLNGYLFHRKKSKKSSGYEELDEDAFF